MKKQKIDYLQESTCKFFYETDEKISDLIRKIETSTKNKKLGCLVRTSTGSILSSKLITGSRKFKNQIRIYRGRNVFRYLTNGYYFIKFDSTSIKGGTQNRDRLGAKEKILIRKTGGLILATYNNQGIYPEQSLYFICDSQGHFSLKYLTALINSKIFHFMYLNKYITNKDSTPQLKKVDLDTFPVGIINFSKPTQKAQHDRMVELVDQMLTTQKQLHETQSPSEKALYQREADGLDNQIDALVYELYELTPAEIKIVEGT